MASVAQTVTSPVDAQEPEKDRKRFLKTELCRYFPRCTKGAACPFAHSQLELQERPDLTKTTLCTEWRKGRCPFKSAECKFAHGPWDLRSPAEAANGTRSRRRRATKTPSTMNTPTSKIFGTPMMSRQVSEASTEAGDFEQSFTRQSTQTSSEDGDFVNVNPYKTMSMSSLDTLDEFDDEPIFWSRQCSELSDSLSVMSRQTSSMAVPQSTLPQGMLQMPVLIDAGSVKMPALATLMHLTPEIVSKTKAVLEKELLAAMPDHYED